MNRQLTIRGGYHRYGEITFLRGFSILTIVLMHYIQAYSSIFPTWVYKATSLGGTGVHAFFLCSGFGLFLSYKNRKSGYIEFIRNRFLKVYIPYAIVILICFFIPAIKVKGNRVVALLSHIFLFKMFSPLYDESFGPFWFISTLFQFYFLFIPLCKVKLKLGNKNFVIVSIIISIIWWIITALLGINEIRIYGSFFCQYLWEFALGMVIADRLSEQNEERVSNCMLIIITIIGLSLEGFLGIKGGWLKAINDIPALFGYVALGLLLWQLRIVRKAMLWLGDISYELYLVHMMIFSLVFTITREPIGIIIELCISVLLAYYYHALFARKKRKKY